MRKMLLDVKFNNTLKCKFTSRCEKESFINAKKFGSDIDKIYTFTVKYDGNEYYNEAEDSATVTVKQMQTGKSVGPRSILKARLILLDFASHLIYYTRKEVTYELLTYEYNYWRRAYE